MTLPNVININVTNGKDQLTENHWLEWVTASGVDPQLTALNVRSLGGAIVYEYLLYALPQTARRNDGRLRDGYLRKYAHTTLGGWWVNGLDPLNNWLPMEWGRFKPDHPRIDFEKNKPVKYESPPKTPNRITYFDIPNCIWDKIAQRYNIKRYHSPLGLRLFDRLNPRLFWEWVQLHREIPIILCEGEKKAACLLSHGFVAIALPGIWNGRVGAQDFDERLHPDLVPLAGSGRKFIILFDYETKASTRWSVFQATVRTGKAIEAYGCTTEVALLPGPEKGVDDFVVSRGKDALALLLAIIDDAKTLADYRRSYRARKWGLSKYKPDVTVNIKYLTQALEIPNFDEEAKAQLFTSKVNSHCPPQSLKQHSQTQLALQQPQDMTPKAESQENSLTCAQYTSGSRASFRFPQSGLVVLWSDMGTGKTELMRWWRNQNPKARFLNNGHRVNLLKNLALRLETAMYSELGYVGLAQATALSITIDSLHKLNTQALTYGCIFIDEACQYLTHLLHSNTCKEHRAAILEVLEYIVYNAPLVVIADAHMDDVTIDFFRAMRPQPEVPYIVKNEWRNGERTIYWYEGNNSSALVAQISAALMSGQKIMVVSDSKRFIKKLEQSLTVQICSKDDNSADKQNLQALKNQLRIWSIHSDNSGAEENIAFIKDITNAVKNLDALLTSPSLGTGVDIAQYHFDLVFGAFHGVSQTATECAQQLYRYRPLVPFHVWVAKRPPFGYKDTNAAKIKERLLQTNEMTAFLLRIDRQTGSRGAEKDWALEAYCQILANRNQSINNLRDDLRSLLSEMGNTFISVGSDDDLLSLENLKKSAAVLDTAYHLAVTRANDITATEYRQRKSKDYLPPEAVFECEKYRIRSAYGMEVTPQLVEKDAGGRLIGALADLEAILEAPFDSIVDPKTGRQYPAPPKIVTDKDRTEREKLPLCIDWGNYSARWLARFNLGLHHILQRLIAGGEMTATDPDLLNMREIASHCAAHIKAILGFTVPSDCEPIWLLAILVEQLGLKLSCRKQGPRGQQVKIYSLSLEELEFAFHVIAHRQQGRTFKESNTSFAHKTPTSLQVIVQPQSAVERKQQPVSTPPHKCIANSPHQGGDTTDFSWKRQGGSEQGAGGTSPALPGCLTEEEYKLHPGLPPRFLPPAPFPLANLPPTDSTTLLHCVEMLRSVVAQGVDAIKVILKRWSGVLRWETVLECEVRYPHELRQLHAAVPEFYALLNEEVLPMEG
ncbi:hypothetical protein NIES37_68770 [Tolypothrix tenuis PCC 7101]|uniref:DUF3854 domain-containing protein n=1 Tax=Tolypothrix tenuis PCC 7101 TaxID=231146 RepID=A0A1Z4NAV7_9CYAN|nr:DUF3854 domain-containing protein [Aulosira sp. FACHB-113]BAZ02864.1 hypothetical protein NIES37_68770 [Tolypothrix tenuis PCC 7101]BAZ78242.1 hypothetical protein NIES50_68750 [Aulosira laxa NIES-50]